jgi:hypothetical protein
VFMIASHEGFYKEAARRWAAVSKTDRVRRPFGRRR